MFLNVPAHTYVCMYVDKKEYWPFYENIALLLFFLLKEQLFMTQIQ